MSELINTHDNRATIRWKLLTGASAFALAAYASSAGVAKAEDANHPLLWIELGGQFSQLADSEERVVPPFILATPRPPPEKQSPMLRNPIRYGFDEDAKISFEPDNSDWIFSAGIRFGRSKGSKNLHQESYPTQPILPPATPSALPFWQYALPFSDVEKTREEKHAILDFQAGKDVGLGKFGTDGASTFNFGVRLAQFTERSDNTFRTQPSWYPSLQQICFFGHCLTKFNGGHYHLNQAIESASRSFHGVGPSISWNASASIAGNSENGEIVLDWGVNAALLFGRQRTKLRHQTTEWYHAAGHRYPTGGAPFRTTQHRYTTPIPTRSRNVTVPNVGGFAGIAWQYDNAKVSFGYKADFFFNAIDGGIDARKNENRAFYGPYASISFGFGD